MQKAKRISSKLDSMTPQTHIQLCLISQSLHRHFQMVRIIVWHIGSLRNVVKLLQSFYFTWTTDSSGIRKAVADETEPDDE